MKTTRLLLTASAAALCALSAAPAQATIIFAYGESYSAAASSTTITEYNAAGNPDGSLTLSTSLGSEVRGLTFGPDGLLYLTEVVGSGFNVLAINSSGTVQHTYTMPAVYAAGSTSYGKIAMDAQYIYVTAASQLTRFTIGNPTSGTVIYSNPNDAFDVNILPNGNLLVASSNSINEITSTGALVRTLDTHGFLLGDIRGLQYVAATGKLFVTMLGYTGEQYQIMRFDELTGVLEKQTTFTYADDLFLAANGNLLVASRTLAPGIFTQELVQVGSLGTAPQMFVTQDTAPEPTSMALLLGGTALLALRRRRSPAGA